MFGPAPGARDLVYDVLKIGIVLTLAFSWPAFRTVIYDVTLKGPAEVASVISTASGNKNPAQLTQRLQAADNSMVELTTLGTGRNTGAFIEGSEEAGTFQGAALQDESALGYARLAFISSVAGSLALLRIAGGLLLALAPIIAGLLFFTGSRGIFAGWLRGLVLVFGTSIGATAVLSVELAILEPWLADALRVRSLGYATPAAPIELFAITLAFALVHFGMIWLLARVAFYKGWIELPSFERWKPDPAPIQSPMLLPAPAGPSQSYAAGRVASSIETVMQREERVSRTHFDRMTSASSPASAAPGGGQSSSPATSGSIVTATPRLGDSYRRTTRRSSSAATRRDRRS
jgi:type IV secretion system protein VirB6